MEDLRLLSFTPFVRVYLHVKVARTSSFVKDSPEMIDMRCEWRIGDVLSN